MAKLLTFQWQQEKYEWGIFLGAGLNPISPALGIKIDRNTLQKNVSMNWKIIIRSEKLFLVFWMIMQLWNRTTHVRHWAILTGITSHQK